MPRLLFALVVFCLLSSTAHAQLIGDLVHERIALETRAEEGAGKARMLRYGSPPVETPFDGIALQGFCTADPCDGWARLEEADGTWGPWTPLYIVRSATDPAFLAAYRGETVYTDRRFELRFAVPDDATFAFVGVGVFDTRLDDVAPQPGDASETAPEAGKTAQDYAILAPDLYDRSEWNAQPFRGSPIPLARPSYQYMTFHHAAGFGAVTLEEGLENVRRIQDFHQNGRGWSDIGYQFVVDESGRVYQGRPFLNGSTAFEDGPPLVMGAHVGGANTGNIGVCALGCYHPPETGIPCRDRMSEAMADSMATMFAFLSERYDVPPARLRGHRDFSATACPGDNNYNNYIRNGVLQAQIEDLLITGNQPLGAVALQASVDEDGIVRLGWSFLEDGGIVAYRVERIIGQQDPEVIYHGAEALPDTLVDSGITQGGPVAYRLTAEDAAGRTQILASTQIVVSTPDGYMLATNFPNPFTTTTTIRYYLEREGLVTLEVFDMLGRLVRTLDVGERGGERWHAVELDASDLPSGTYYYRLVVDGFSGVEYERTRSFTRIR